MEGARDARHDRRTAEDLRDVGVPSRRTAIEPSGREVEPVGLVVPEEGLKRPPEEATQGGVKPTMSGCGGRTW